jgi:hypothetical protein
MKVKPTSPSDQLAQVQLVPRFHDLLACVDDEELLEVFHDFFVRASNSDQGIVSDQRSDSSTPRGLPTKTPPRGRGQ